jgi:hypothetical protein
MIEFDSKGKKIIPLLMKLKNDTNYIQIHPLHTNFIDLNHIYKNLTMPFQ